MFTANAKIIKSGGAEPDQFEASISNALLELEMNSDLKSHLRELYITKAKELETNNKKSIIIYVPMPKLKAFQKIQTRLVRELEKKFSGKHVMFVGERKILPKPTRKTRTKNKQKRPRSRTLTSVYDALLEDIVYPVEIVGKRIRVKLDGSQVIKVHLDKNEQTNIEHKVDTFASVYKQLTGRDVTFEFPESYGPAEGQGSPRRSHARRRRKGLVYKGPLGLRRSQNSSINGEERKSLGSFDRSASAVKGRGGSAKDEETRRRGESGPQLIKRQSFSVADPIGTSTSRWSHRHGLKQRGSINHGQSGHQSVDGTAREAQDRRVQPETSVKRKPAVQRGTETWTNKWTNNKYLQGDLAFLDDRGRSSEIKSDDRAILRFTHISSYITRIIISIKFTLYYGEFVELLSRFLKRFSHLYVAQEAKTGFHVSTRPA